MRVLLADDQSDVRFALRTLLEREPGVQVLGEAVGSEVLLGQMKVDCPDLVLLDWALPGMAGDELLLILRAACPDVSVVVLGGQPEAGVRRAVLDAGADAYVSKTDPPEQLLAAIKSVRPEEV